MDLIFGYPGLFPRTVRDIRVIDVLTRGMIENTRIRVCPHRESFDRIISQSFELLRLDINEGKSERDV